MTPVEIRLARGKDADQVAEIYRPCVEGTAISFEEAAPGSVEMANRIAFTLRTLPWLVCAKGSAVLGFAYASRHRQRKAYRWAVEASVYVAVAWRRLGIARALYTTLFRVLVLQGHRHAYAGITLPNPPSVALHESLGFQPVGIYREIGFKLGTWRDVGWWHLKLADLADYPVSPVPLPAVVGRSGWREALSAGSRSLRNPSDRLRS